VYLFTLLCLLFVSVLSVNFYHIENKRRSTTNMRNLIPATVIATCTEVISENETHAAIDSLFSYAGAPGEPPEGSKPVKIQEWLRRINKDNSIDPLKILGRILEKYMEESIHDIDSFHNSETDNQIKIKRVLTQYNLHYERGGMSSTSISSLSHSLKNHIENLNIPTIEQEFKRALLNVDSNPRDAVSAASNILESLCKIYIEEEKLDVPAKQDLKPIWNIVCKDLGLDPSILEDNDLKSILSGLFAIVNGIGALRTHASSAHGAGKKSYKLEPRHAKLAIHSAHTVALFILETWQHKKGKLK
jgi:hypothetical protein